MIPTAVAVLCKSNKKGSAVKKLLISLALLSTVGTAPLVYAETPTDRLGTCLVDNLSGKERKELGKWVFFAIAAHPDMAAFSNATPTDIKTTDMYVGQLITRLLTENCPSELKKANDSDPRAVEQAFRLVGQVAMQELMTNQAVRDSLTNYAQFADMQKINAVFAK